MQSGQILKKEEILTFLRNHKKELNERFGVTKIALFGSHVRGDARIDSDVDLLIEMPKRSFDKQFYLKEFLEAHFQKKVDIGSFDSLHPFVMRFVEKELVYA